MLPAADGGASCFFSTARPNLMNILSLAPFLVPFMLISGLSSQLGEFITVLFVTCAERGALSEVGPEICTDEKFCCSSFETRAKVSKHCSLKLI
jgi:hypothetical protein